MKKKIISLLVIITLLCSTSLTYADTVNFKRQTGIRLKNSEEVAEYVERVIGEEKINNNIIEKKNYYYVEGAGCDIIVPKDGQNHISIQSEVCDISMSLPDEVKKVKSIVSEKGTAIYNCVDEDMSVAVQAISDKQMGVTIDSVRTMVTIENATAPRIYEFDFYLPDGCRLLKSEDYHGNNSDAGYIYIVNDNNRMFDVESGTYMPELLGVIEPAWAIDANGNRLDIRHEISGKTLKQIVEFNDNSVFPIVANATTSTKPKNEKIETVLSESFKLNNATLGLPGLGASAVTAILTEKAKEKATSIIVAKLGSKAIPIVNWALFGLSAYCTYQGYKGYTYTKVSIVCDLWAIYKHQGGRWVRGFGYKVNLSVEGSN